MKRILVVGATLLLGIGAVWAQQDAAKEAQTFMKGNGKNAGALSAMVKGEKPYDQATEILARDVPSIHLWHRRVFTGYNARVQGFTPYPDGIIRLKGLKL